MFETRRIQVGHENVVARSFPWKTSEPHFGRTLHQANLPLSQLVFDSDLWKVRRVNPKLLTFTAGNASKQAHRRSETNPTSHHSVLIAQHIPNGPRCARCSSMTLYQLELDPVLQLADEQIIGPMPDRVIEFIVPNSEAAKAIDKEYWVKKE